MPTGRLYREPDPAQGIRATSAAYAAGRGCCALRDAAWQAGAGRLRFVSISVGEALRLSHRTGLFAALVGQVLQEADDAGRDLCHRRSVRLLRWCAERDSLRPDEGGHYR